MRLGRNQVPAAAPAYTAAASHIWFWRAHLVSHVVRDEAEVAGVHANAVRTKDGADLGHHRRARGLDAERAQHRTDVIRGHGGGVNDVAVGPGALKIDAVRLHRHRVPRLARLLLHHVAALNACTAAQHMSSISGKDFSPLP